MLIPQTSLNETKCCKSNDIHIVMDPVFFKYNRNACMQRIRDSKGIDSIRQYSDCNVEREMKDFSGIKIPDMVNQTLMNDFFDKNENRIKTMMEFFESTVYQ